MLSHFSHTGSITMNLHVKFLTGTMWIAYFITPTLITISHMLHGVFTVKDGHIEREMWVNIAYRHLGLILPQTGTTRWLLCLSLWSFRGRSLYLVILHYTSLYYTCILVFCFLFVFGIGGRCDSSLQIISVPARALPNSVNSIAVHQNWI